MTSSIDDATIRAYLLKQLDEEQRDSVEIAILEDQDLFERVKAVEIEIQRLEEPGVLARLNKVQAIVIAAVVLVALTMLAIYRSSN